jgi:Glycosyl transferase family 11
MASVKFIGSAQLQKLSVSIDGKLSQCIFNPLATASAPMVQIVRELSAPTVGSLHNTVIVHIKGGLGNQMFQYAAGLAVARRTGSSLKLDTTWFDAYKNRPFTLRAWHVNEAEATKNELEFFGVYIPENRWMGRARRVRRYLLKRWLVSRIYNQPGHHYDPGIVVQTSPILLNGYFQSELFFSSIADEIRSVFRPREPMSGSSQAMLQTIESTEWPVALHVRRGDYVKNPGAYLVHGITSPDYYRRAIAMIDNLSGGRAHYFVFSDEPAAVLDVLGAMERRTLVSGNADRPWEDVTLMAACCSNVMANSSFSWWGAWLNSHPDKIVIAPRRWFQPDTLLVLNTRDLIPDGWITI